MSPRIFGSLFVGTVVLLICSVSVVFCWVGCEKRGRGFGRVKGQLVLFGSVICFL